METERTKGNRAAIILSGDRPDLPRRASRLDPPRRIRFYREGGQLQVLHGEWRLIPLDGGARTRVLYESRASTPFAIPAPIARMALRRDIPDALAALRREVMARK